MKIKNRLFLRLVLSQSARRPRGGRLQNLSASATASIHHIAAPVEKQRLIFVSPLPGRWIRQTGCLVVLASLLTAGLVHAASDSDAMNAANNAFAQGHYFEAAQSYEAITIQRGYSAPVLFNLANARQNDGELGQAILNYERAALLNPNDAGIAVNLRAARQKAGVELEHSSLPQKAARTLTMNAWFGLATVALFLFVLTWPLKLLYPHGRRALNIGSAMAMGVLAVTLGALGLRSQELDRAVVVATEAVAGVSPVTMAQPLYKLRAGEIVTLQQVYGGFALIRNHAGQEGWVNTDKIEQIIPAGAGMDWEFHGGKA